MRFFSAFAGLLLLAACGYVGGTRTPDPVDPSHLPPLTGQEQALMVGASGSLAQGNTDAAEKDYQSAVGASTGRVEAHLALARMYQTQHRAGDERAVLLRARAFQPNHPLVNYRLGKLDLADGDASAAFDDFRQGLKAAPTSIDLLSGAGVADDMLGRHAEAQRFYARAIAQNPGVDLSGVKTNLGMSYLLSNDPKRAVEVLKDEAKKPGASSTTKQNLALAYGVLGRNTEAKALVHGQMDEETRQLSIARLKEYWTDRSPAKNPLLPAVHPKSGDVDADPTDLSESQ